MPDQRYEAARQTIGALLSYTSPHIEVPEWQRSYSWRSEEVNTFWQDLLNFDARVPNKNLTNQEYFLGSIVLVTGGETNLLLDGQQRLATATILLSALRDARRSFSRDAALRLQSKYISDYDDATSSTTYVLTLNRYDRDFFRSEIQDEPHELVSTDIVPKLRSHDLIRKARRFFDEQIQTASRNLGGGQLAFDWNLRIGQVLCNHMSVVAVTSTDEDNAAEVFETLNDRGIGLSTLDLLRNFVLRRCPDEDTRNRVVNAWQSVLSIGDEVSVEMFLRHYWVSRYGDVKARKLYREIKDRIEDDDIKSLRLSLDLMESAQLYREIVATRDDDQDIRRGLRAVRDLGARSLYPAILSGYAAIEPPGDKSKGHLCRLIDALVTMFVRYNVIGGREASVMETNVYEIAKDLRDSGNFEAAIERLRNLSPDATSFIMRFRQASIGKISIARYLLREIEHAKRRTRELVVEDTSRVHVEHIYPQTPSGQAWRNHKSIVNRLGNLTLLGKRFNTSIKNASFSVKKRKAYADSDILMTRELVALARWDAAAVERRQAELSEWAFGIWKFPGEPPPVLEPDMSGSVKEVHIPALPDMLPLWDEDDLPEAP